jgi:hypothetical protein
MAVNDGRGTLFPVIPPSVVACSYACPGSLNTALSSLWLVFLPVILVGFLTGDISIS